METITNGILNFMIAGIAALIPVAFIVGVAAIVIRYFNDQFGR